MAARQHGVDRGRRRVAGRRHAGPVLGYRPAGVRAAPHLSDVILVGASTVRRSVRSRPGSGTVASPAGRPHADATDRGGHRAARSGPGRPLVTAAPPYARTIVITTARRPRSPRQLARHADVIVAGQETVDLTARRRAGRARHRRMLAEGGPRLLAQLIGAGLVDELCLTIGPLLAGPGANRIAAVRPGCPAAAADVGSRRGGRRFPVLPLRQERSLSRTDRARAPTSVASLPPAS